MTELSVEKDVTDLNEVTNSTVNAWLHDVSLDSGRRVRLLGRPAEALFACLAAPR